MNLQFKVCQILMFSKTSFQKGLILLAPKKVLYFYFWKKNLRTLFVLHRKRMEIKLFPSFSCFINIIYLPFCKLQLYKRIKRKYQCFWLKLVSNVIEKVIEVKQYVWTQLNNSWKTFVIHVFLRRILWVILFWSSFSQIVYENAVQNNYHWKLIGKLTCGSLLLIN